MHADPETTSESQIVRRADWWNDTQYPAKDTLDSSIWAWEFLRRNAAYQADYDQYRDRYRTGSDAPYLSLPPRPNSDQLLVNYYCDPLPSRRNLTYGEYKNEAPEHTIYPIRDHLRAKWEINSLPDPRLDWRELVTKTKLHVQRLFARNTVDVRQPVGNLARAGHLYVTSMLCTHEEILVRLRLDGNIERQLEDLKRQRDGFFKTVRVSQNRSVNAMTLRTAADIRPGTDDRADKTAIHIDPSYLPDASDIDEINEASIEIPITGWDHPKLQSADLHYVLRAADALADFRAGELKTADEGPRLVKDNAPDVLVKLLCKCPNPYGDVFAPNTVRSWLDLADSLINDGIYKRLARSNFADAKEKAKKKAKKKNN